MRRWVVRLKRRDPHQAEVYEAWLGAVLSDHADRIIPVDAETADEWGRMSVPVPVPIVDGLTAATAKVRNMTLERVAHRAAPCAGCPGPRLRARRIPPGPRRSARRTGTPRRARRRCLVAPFGAPVPGAQRAPARRSGA